MTMQKVSKKNAESFKWGTNCDGWHLVKLPNVSVIQERMLPKTSEVKHYHKKTWQFIYVLEGELALEMGDDWHSLSAHEGIEMPPVVPHNFVNKSEKDIWYLLISLPNDPLDRTNIGQ